MTNGSKLDAFIQEIDVSGWDNLPPDKRLEILQRFENVMAESEKNIGNHRELWDILMEKVLILIQDFL